MNFKLKCFLFSLSLLLFCSFIGNQINKETEFSKTCLKISSEFKTQNNHGHIYNSKTEKYLSLPEFSKILKSVSKYDLEKNVKYKVEQNNTGKIEKTIWLSTLKKAKLVSVEKLTFKTIIEQEYQGKKYNNEFVIIDYIITRNELPKNIRLRIMENNFEKISIDDVEYYGVFKSRILGIDEAKDEFDKLLEKK